MSAKIFVGGLNWNTTDDAFRTFFETYGEIEDAVVMRDRNTGTSRGFGFVTFKNSSGVDGVLSAGDLELDGRKVDCKAAVPREEIGKPGMAPLQQRTKKIFVGGLLPETTEEEFKNYFSQFGEVSEATIMMDRTTSRSRGFGFVTFDTENAVEKVCANLKHAIDGKAVECKKAIPKQSMGMAGGRGGFGGRGGGFGGFGGRGGGFGGRGGFGGGYGGFGGGYGGGYPPAGGYGPARGAGGGYGGAAAAGGYGGGYGGEAYGAGEGAYGMSQQSAYGGQQQMYGGADAYGAPNPYASEGAYPQQAYGGASAYEGQTMRSSKTDRAFHPYR